jgi:hypothetical protein
MGAVKVRGDSEIHLQFVEVCSVVNGNGETKASDGTPPSVSPKANTEANSTGTLFDIIVPIEVACSL